MSDGFLIGGRFVSYMDVLEQRHHFASYVHELGDPPTICGVPLREWIDRLQSDPENVDVYLDVINNRFFTLKEGKTRCPTIPKTHPEDWRLGPLSRKT